MHDERTRSAPTIAAARARDVAAISRIAYDTAFFGAPADPFFPSERLLSDLWVGPYLAAGHVLVAHHADDVVGYCLGIDDPRDYRAAVRRLVPIVIGRLLRGAYPGAWGCARFGLAALGDRHPHAPLGTFPAHLHMNVRAGARGLGVGRRLLEAYLAAARDRGVPGIQVSTTSRNVAAVSLYSSLGFVTWSRAESTRWRRWLEGPVEHVVMTALLEPAPSVSAAAPAARD